MCVPCCRGSDAVQKQSFSVWASELRQCNGVNGIIRVYRSGWLQWRRALRCLIEHTWQLPRPDPSAFVWTPDWSPHMLPEPETVSVWCLEMTPELMLLNRCTEEKLALCRRAGIQSTLKGPVIGENVITEVFTVQRPHTSSESVICRPWPEDVSGNRLMGLKRIFPVSEV